VTSTGNVYAVESSIFTPQRILEATSAEPSKVRWKKLVGWIAYLNQGIHMHGQCALCIEHA